MGGSIRWTALIRPVTVSASGSFAVDTYHTVPHVVLYGKVSWDLTRLYTCDLLCHVTTTNASRKKVPAGVYKLPLGERWRWARKSSKKSHDRIVEEMGRSNRSHLIKIERGIVQNPRPELRDSYADATNVPRALFTEPEDAAQQGGPFLGKGLDGGADAAAPGASRGTARDRKHDLKNAA